MEKGVTILYVLSPSYSGSTLLSLLLGNQENVYGAGELFVFSKHPDRIKALETSKCSCEKVEWNDCIFWSKINNYLSQNYNLTLDQLDVESEDVDTFQKHNLAILEALSSNKSTSIILDSSKLLERYLQYEKAGFSIIPIVLKRTPCAVVYSWVKRGYNWLEVAHYYTYFYEELCKQVDRNTLEVKYEELVDSPKYHLKRILQNTKVASTVIDLNWQHQTYHHLSGNPMLNNKTSQLNIDDSWKSELSVFQKAIIRFVTLSVNVNKVWFYRFWRKLIHISFWIFHTRKFKRLQSKVKPSKIS